MTIGERLRAARENAGLTQNELGAMIGVTGVAIMRYEKGVRQPRVEQLQAIASALDIPIGQLLPFFAEDDKRVWLDVIRDIGLPRGIDNQTSVATTKKIISQVAEAYGEKSALLLRITSIMNDEGIDKVIAYAKSIFQEHFESCILCTDFPNAPEDSQADSKDDA